MDIIEWNSKLSMMIKFYIALHCYKFQEKCPINVHLNFRNNLNKHTVEKFVLNLPVIIHVSFPFPNNRIVLFKDFLKKCIKRSEIIA